MATKSLFDDNPPPPLSAHTLKRLGGKPKVRAKRANKAKRMGSTSYTSSLMRKLADNLTAEERKAVKAMAEEAAMARGSSSSLLPSKQTQMTNAADSPNGSAVAVANGKGGGNLADPTLVRRGFTIEQKRYLVEKFARFHTVKETGDAFAARFGFRPDNRVIANYDADSHHWKGGKRLRDLFDALRRDYTDNLAKVAVSHQGHRLRLLEALVSRATTAREFSAAIKAIELASKEMGALTQYVQHSGTVVNVHTSVEEAKAELAMRLQAMVDGGTLERLALPDNTEGAPSE